MHFRYTQLLTTIPLFGAIGVTERKYLQVSISKRIRIRRHTGVSLDKGEHEKTYTIGKPIVDRDGSGSTGIRV